MNLEVKAYDEEGNEIKIPEGHSMVMGKDSTTFIKNEEFACEFVYRQPSEDDPRYHKLKKLLDK